MIRSFALLIPLAIVTPLSQQPPVPTVPLEPPGRATPSAIEKLGPTTYRVGQMRIDTAKREVSVPGTVNGVSTLEFLANTVGGAKAYESALTLNTNAVSFNAALLLIGLDPSRSRPAKMQFDDTPPRGDPVEVTIEWQVNGKPRRVPIEELLFDGRTKKTVPQGPWVYTGSTFIDYGDGTGKYYLAEVDGVLIGFMHGPQAIIDNPRNDALGGYGFFVLNPALHLTENTAVSVTIKALPRQ